MTHINKNKPSTGVCKRHIGYNTSIRMEGEGNSIHKMDPDARRKMCQEKAEYGRAVIETMKEEVAEKKSASIRKAIANGFRPQDNAGWGGGGRPRVNDLPYSFKGAEMTKAMYDALSKE